MLAIPSNQGIIGVKCDNKGSDFSLTHLSFLLGEKGTRNLSGELRFPNMQTYPTQSLYDDYLQEKTHHLSTI